jgi:exonuclease SbcD
MQLLLFADLHLDTPFRWAPVEVARARRRALRSTLTRIVELAGERQVDALVCAGDLYEQDRFGPDTGEFLRRSFAQLSPMPVLIAPGNHDWYGPASLYAQTAWTDNVRIFADPDWRPVELADGLTVWGCGHPSPAVTADPLAGFHTRRGGVNIALLHGSERSGLPLQAADKVAHAPFDAAAAPAAGLDHLLAGHFHAPCDGPWHTYPGNPDPLTFGESGGRAAVLCTVDGRGQVLRERCDVAVSTVSRLDIDVTGAGDLDEIRQRVEATLRGVSGVVEVRVQGSLAVPIAVRPADLAGLGSWLDGLLFRIATLPPLPDVEVLQAERTVRGQFVRDVLGSSLDPATRARVLRTGLHALAGQPELIGGD